MKKVFKFLVAGMFMLAALPAFSQKYKTVADTAALNVEYAKVNLDITQLNAKLDKAKAEQADDQKKVTQSTADASNSSASASADASTANGGSVKEAKTAERASKQSVSDAKDASQAKNDLIDCNKKIDKLTAELQKKQDRLKELDGMRNMFRGTPAAPAPAPQQ